MVNPLEVSALLELLHRQGYRLVRLGADSLEVSTYEAAPTGAVSEGQPGKSEDELAREEAEFAMWGHVGGRPRGLRAPGGAPQVSFADDGAGPGEKSS